MNGTSTAKEHGSEPDDASPKPGFTITESGGDRYESLEAALEASLDEVADAMAKLILSYLETGKLIVVDGVVKFPEQTADQ